MSYGHENKSGGGADIQPRDTIQSAFVKAADLIKMVSESCVTINQFMERAAGPVPELPNPESKQVKVGRPGQLGELHDALDALTSEVRNMRVIIARLETL